ncbi:MAG: SusD/RagB family nutrient-binding outer membrane lipoprotein [Algicola sp.]|nr:SusD/RagB family nutrient-binding outer membrane lipoprotein [Algicola sp.]
MMKTYYNNIYRTASSILSICVVLLMFSCENVLVNEDPNGANLNDLSPEVVFPGAQTRPSATFMTTMNQLGNTMIATWSGNAQQIQAPFFDEFSQQITTDFYSGVWNNTYIRTGNLTNIINFESDTNYDYYKGAAKILRTFYMQYLVDMYGDIPYTDMHRRGDILFPSYDDQEEVYKALVTDINDAIAQINNTDQSTVVSLGASDVMLGGDMEQWKKFGNTIKLRLLVRLMELAETDGETQAYIQSEMSSLNQAGTSFLQAGEDVTINPGYSDQTSRMNPFAETFGYLPGSFGVSGSETVSNTTVGPTTFLVEYLDGTSNGIQDDRLSRLYTPRSGATIVGNTQGGPNINARLGAGLLFSPIQDGIIMTASESLFLQSEAAFRGYLTNVGSPKALFQAGIAASFDRLGANLGNYLNDSDNVQGIGWEGTSDKVEAIITQKWIDLGGTNGAETWIEFNRTGYPSNMPLPEIATQPTQAKRLLYPTSEYTGNSANVSVYNQTLDTAFDTPIFWDVN